MFQNESFGVGFEIHFEVRDEVGVRQEIDHAEYRLLQGAETCVSHSVDERGLRAFIKLQGEFKFGGKFVVCGFLLKYFVQENFFRLESVSVPLLGIRKNGGQEKGSKGFERATYFRYIELFVSFSPSNV